MDALVSVVMPVYNPGGLFDAALQTVLSQSWTNLEIVISVDGEFDEKRLPADARIRCVYNQTGRRGIFPNLNNAIREARGSLIQIFCQDDLMFPYFIEVQAGMLLKHPDCDMIFCNYRVIGQEKTVVPGTAVETQWRAGNLIGQHMNREYFMNSLFAKGCMPGNLSPVMLTKTVFDELGLFNEAYQYCGDYEMWARVATRYNTLYLPQQLLAVRVHAQQASNTLPLAAKIDELVKVYRFLFDHITIKKSRRYLNWYINQHTGMSLFYLSVRQNISSRFRNMVNFRYLRKSPYSIGKIVTLYIITVLGRVPLFKIPPGLLVSR